MALKLSVPIEYDVVQGYKRRWRYKYYANDLDYATPTYVSQCLEEHFLQSESGVNQRNHMSIAQSF